MIMIDRSASMQTMDGSWRGETVSRLEQAKREALEVIDQLGEPTWLDSVMGGADAGAERATVITFDAFCRMAPMPATQAMMTSVARNPSVSMEPYPMGLASASVLS